MMRNDDKRNDSLAASLRIYGSLFAWSVVGLFGCDSGGTQNAFQPDAETPGATHMTGGSGGGDVVSGGGSGGSVQAGTGGAPAAGGIGPGGGGGEVSGGGRSGNAQAGAGGTPAAGGTGGSMGAAGSPASEIVTIHDDGSIEVKPPIDTSPIDEELFFHQLGTNPTVHCLLTQPSHRGLGSDEAIVGCSVIFPLRNNPGNQSVRFLPSRLRLSDYPVSLASAGGPWLVEYIIPTNRREDVSDISSRLPKHQLLRNAEVFETQRPPPWVGAVGSSVATPSIIEDAPECAAVSLGDFNSPLVDTKAGLAWAKLEGQYDFTGAVAACAERPGWRLPHSAEIEFAIRHGSIRQAFVAHGETGNTGRCTFWGARQYGKDQSSHTISVSDGDKPVSERVGTGGAGRQTDGGASLSVACVRQDYFFGTRRR
jgi:hypothetical protein